MKSIMIFMISMSCAIIASDNTHDVASTIALLLEEDIINIKGRCGLIGPSKVYAYAMREIAIKKVAIPGFEENHLFELQQLTTDATNYNEIYKTLCDNAVQSDIYSSLITDGVVITPYTPLREQALNVVIPELETIRAYQQ